MKTGIFYACALAIVLGGCSGVGSESVSDSDSSASGGYEDFSEVGPFTIKDEILSDRMIINGKTATVKDFLVRFYAPDSFVPYNDSTQNPGYIITDAQLVEDEFFAGPGRCTKRSVVMTSRGDFVDHEYYDLLFLDAEHGDVRLVDKQTLDGSEGQSSTIITVSTEALAADKDCVALEVSTSTEGGDINLHKEEWVEYFVADSVSFQSVLRLQLERTDIQDYELANSDNQSSSSELREVEILEKSNNGMLDIRARYTRRENGEVVMEEDEVYVYDGAQYRLR